ncbi:MAG: SDR family oxidoreductase [Turicibacter sp.]|nr:SDR family oxidoreductase [Turicibacter sp.]
MSYFIVTGASSGIGEAMCEVLAKQEYNLIMVARRMERLEQLKAKLSAQYTCDIVIMLADLSDISQLKPLYEKCKNYPVIGLINNAGYGLYGEFLSLDIEDEWNMIDVNIKSVHYLTKLFLNDFVLQDKGYLLNVASTAAFQSGPLMGTYYATKGYVLQLTEAIAKELKVRESKVVVSTLCPGPVDTEFQQRAKIKVAKSVLKPPTAKEVATYAYKELMKGKVLIIPGASNKILLFFNRLIPRKLGCHIVYQMQLKKK